MNAYILFAICISHDPLHITGLILTYLHTPGLTCDTQDRSERKDNIHNLHSPSLNIAKSHERIDNNNNKKSLLKSLSH